MNEKQLKAVKWIDTSNQEEEDDCAPPTASSSSATAENMMAATPRPGSMLRMRLIQRPQITTLALPRSATWPSDLLPPLQGPFHFLPDVMTYSKFMLATPTALIADLSHDLDDLATEKRILSGMNDDLGVAFVDAAEFKVRHQMAKAAALETPQLKHAIDSAYQALHRVEDRAAFLSRKEQKQRTVDALVEDVPDAFLASKPSVFNPPSFSADVPPTPILTGRQSRNAKQRRNVNPPPPTSSYYYYQAASGMPVFLHPLDIKILLSHFNSYPAFPDTITVKVDSHAESTVNDDLRKRYKYLSHFPEGADVVFVETDLEGVVGQDGLKNFERALSGRRVRRKEKDKKDEKARARAEEREKEKIVHNWNEMTRHRVDAYIPLPPRRTPSPAGPDFSDFPEPGQARPTQQERQHTSGAWGARSFASAAQHPTDGARIVSQQRQAQTRRGDYERDADDEWDLDSAFHALEQRGGRGGGRKKNARMVVLGGGGSRRR